MLSGVVPFPPDYARRYREKGYWQDKPLAQEFAAVFKQFADRVVLIDGAPEVSCTHEVGTLAGRTITTLEGLSSDGALHPLQQALLDEQAGQCGYCLAGIVISAAALLARNPKPSRADIVAALDPHLCRCGIHNRVIRAVQNAGAAMAGGR